MKLLHGKKRETIARKRSFTLLKFAPFTSLGSFSGWTQRRARATQSGARIRARKQRSVHVTRLVPAVVPYVGDGRSIWMHNMNICRAW